MTERERLIKMLRTPLNCLSPAKCNVCSDNNVCRVHTTADYLLEQDVIVPPCKVGDKVYQYDNGGRIYESTIVWFYYDKDYKRIVYCCNTELAFSEEAIGKSVYLSRKEAEEAEGRKK